MLQSKVAFQGFVIPALCKVCGTHCIYIHVPRHNEFHAYPIEVDNSILESVIGLVEVECFFCTIQIVSKQLYSFKQEKSVPIMQEDNNKESFFS